MNLEFHIFKCPHRASSLLPGDPSSILYPFLISFILTASSRRFSSRLEFSSRVSLSSLPLLLRLLHVYIRYTELYIQLPLSFVSFLRAAPPLSRSILLSLNIPNFFPFCSFSTTPVPVCPVASILLRYPSLPRFHRFHPVSLSSSHFPSLKLPLLAIILAIIVRYIQTLARHVTDFYVFVGNLKRCRNLQMRNV